MIAVRKATLLDRAMIDVFIDCACQEIDRYSKLGVNVDKVKGTVYSFIENDEHGVLFFAEDDGVVCGAFMGGLSDEWQSDARIAFDMINYVLPEHRSKGVARELANSFIDWAKLKGAAAVQCGTSTNVNTEHAKSLYSSLGFKEIGVFMEMTL
mgnify:CR=1 FL=1